MGAGTLKVAVMGTFVRGPFSKARAFLPVESGSSALSGLRSASRFGGSDLSSGEEASGNPARPKPRLWPRVMPTYLRDLFELPAQVRQGDFVLRLTEGVQKSDETLASYVLTEQLTKCFDRSLGLIQAALDTRSSKGTYLHGSFGSGKSHFMAVLMLLLEHHPAAWRIPELASVLGRHGWARDKRCLLVPFHMIGAKDMTSALLGGYVERVRKLHPDKAHPGVYRSEGILESARKLRGTMGDPQFFGALSAGTPAGADDGWGTMGGAWNAAEFEAAEKAHPTDERRVRLVGDLVATLFPHTSDTGDFVDLDNGLAIVSQHAKALGYDAVILFLDELILWLAGYAANPGFVTQQGQLISKLVEAQNANRPAPLVSFIARQRDLRELVGENMLGNQYVSFSNSMQWWEERFDVIKLDDRNLATIAQKRVLKPRNDAARLQIEHAFRDTERVRREVMDVLLTSHGNRDEFHKIYPFSPALMETLVALSSLLQRERTALKIMFQLLVEQQDRLKLGDLVPVGDLFDVLLSDAQPLSSALQEHFEQARKLYRQRLLPLMEADHGLTREAADQLPADDSRAVAFRRDDRLAKTLLLSALAPEVESFKGMTVNRLAALNHGTIKTPIPGKEGAVVFNTLKRWAATVGQIRLGDEPSNQTVNVQLAAVDLDGILRAAGSEDNGGNRIRKVKELVYGMMGFQLADEFWIPHVFSWRATKRKCQVLFANVRELPDESLRNSDEEWKVILDFPFDPEAICGPQDDLARLQKFQAQNVAGARTIAWMPSFLSKTAQNELGQLVLHDHVLAGSRLDSYAGHLSAVDKSQARVLLENQRSALQQRVRSYLDAAYGIGSEKSALDATHSLEPDQQIQSLDHGLNPPIPAGANLRQAVEQVLDAALAAQFPAHPAFDPDARTSGVVVKRVLEELESAASAPDGRWLIDGTLRRDVKALVGPLKLASTGDSHGVLQSHWKTHFLQRAAQDGGPITVAKLRKWIDDPQLMGLPTELQDLIVLTFALQTDRTFILHGGAVEPALGSLRPDMELREQPLPDETAWRTALERAQAVFGLVPGAVRSATHAAKLAMDLKAKAAECLPAVRELADELPRRMAALGLESAESDRVRAVQEARQLVEVVRSATDRQVIESFAGVPVTSPLLVVGIALKTASAAHEALRQVRWEIFDAITKIEGAGAPIAARIRQELKDALMRDPQAIDLASSLRRLEGEATRLVISRISPSPSAPTPASTGPGSPPTHPTSPVPPAAVASGTVSPGTSPISVPPTTGLPESGAAPWAGSDEAEVLAVFRGDLAAQERHRGLVRELKRLYGSSQVKGDGPPPGLSQAMISEVLEVHHIQPLSRGGADARSNMMVLTPTLHALVHADRDCRIDLAGGEMVLFGVRLSLDVRSDHAG